jgi:hypothetical protein
VNQKLCPFRFSIKELRMTNQFRGLELAYSCINFGKWSSRVSNSLAVKSLGSRSAISKIPTIFGRCASATPYIFWFLLGLD